MKTDKSNIGPCCRYLRSSAFIGGFLDF